MIKLLIVSVRPLLSQGYPTRLSGVFGSPREADLSARVLTRLIHGADNSGLASVA